MSQELIKPMKPGRGTLRPVMFVPCVLFGYATFSPLFLDWLFLGANGSIVGVLIGVGQVDTHNKQGIF